MHKNKTKHSDLTTIVQDLLADDAFHCDGFYEEAGSFDAALKKQKQTVSFLYKTICRDHALLSTQLRLLRCKIGQRCLSAACTVCAKAFQNAETQLGYEALHEAGYEPTDLVFVSIVSPDWRVQPGYLTADRYLEIHQQAKGVVRKCDLNPFLGGIDISANWIQGETGSHYQVQLAGLTPAACLTRSIDLLRELVPKADGCRRPIYSKKFDGDPKALAYCLKPTFQGRESYIDSNISRPDRGPSLNTRSRPMRVPERIEMLKLLNQIGLLKRKVRRGARLVRADGGIRMVVRNPRAG